MPTINAIDFDLESREIMIADILALISCPPDDLPFVASHAAVGELVSTGEGPHVFRAEEFLGVTTVWIHANTSAIVFFFYRQRLILVDVILMGLNRSHDAITLRWARERLSLSVEEVSRIIGRRRPTLVRFVSRASTRGNANLLSLLVVVPVLCELNEVS